MRIDNEQCEVAPGTAVYIPPNTVQSIENIDSEPLAFVCIVDPAWQPENEIVLEKSSTV